MAKKVIKKINGKDEEKNPSLYDLLATKRNQYESMSREDFNSLVTSADQTELKKICREMSVTTFGSLQFIRDSLKSDYDKKAKEFELNKKLYEQKPKDIEISPELKKALERL